MAMSYSWLLLFHTLSLRLPSGNQPWLSGQSPIYFGNFPSELNLVRILRDTKPWPRSQWPAHTWIQANAGSVILSEQPPKPITTCLYHVWVAGF